MKCPFCDHTESYVVDTRPNDEHQFIRRRRVCEACNKRFTTFEKVQLRKLMILKRSGVKKLFERQKIEKAITTALHKRNKTDNQVNELINRVILEIENYNLREISTRKIGDIIMRELADFDEVAYDFAMFVSKLKK